MKEYKGYETVYLPSGRREKIYRAELKRKTEDLLNEWSEYFENN